MEHPLCPPGFYGALLRPHCLVNPCDYLKELSIVLINKFANQWTDVKYSQCLNSRTTRQSCRGSSNFIQYLICMAGVYMSSPEFTGNWKWEWCIFAKVQPSKRVNSSLSINVKIKLLQHPFNFFKINSYFYKGVQLNKTRKTLHLSGRQKVAVPSHLQRTRTRLCQ